VALLTLIWLAPVVMEPRAVICAGVLLATGGVLMLWNVFQPYVLPVGLLTVPCGTAASGLWSPRRREAPSGWPGSRGCCLRDRHHVPRQPHPGWQSLTARYTARSTELGRRWLR
jgi:hypothetical protein